MWAAKEPFVNDNDNKDLYSILVPVNTTNFVKAISQPTYINSSGAPNNEQAAYGMTHYWLYFLHSDNFVFEKPKDAFTSQSVLPSVKHTEGFQMAWTAVLLESLVVMGGI